MSRLSLKNDFKDGEVLYGKELNTNNDATVAAVNDNYERIISLQDLKADVVDVNDKLALKVDESVFNTAIDSLNTTKANISLVNTKADKSELEAKADKIEVQQSLNNKADISYVNSQLGVKANSSDLGNLSNLKTNNKSSAVAAINELKENGVANNIDGISITNNSDGKIQTVGVIDNNDGKAVKTWTGTKEEYDALETKNSNTLYYIIDDDDEHELVANKVTSISDSSTDKEYPSAKAVNDKIKASAPDLSNYVQNEDLNNYVQNEDLNDYVQNEDYATYDKAGVVRANSSGFNVGTDGIPKAEQYNLNNYKSISNNTFMSKGTLENIKNDYVGTSEPINVLNDNLDNIVPKQNITDNIININDALKYKTFNFKVDGAYEQNGEPTPEAPIPIITLSFDKIIKIGQNLLPNTFYSKNADYSIDDDGWVSVTFNNSGGTSNQYFNLYYDSAKLKPNKNYNVILEVKEFSGNGTVVVCSNTVFSESKEGQFSTDYRLTFSSLQSGKIYNKICLTKTDLDNIVTSTQSFVQADPGQAGSITFRISVLEDTSITPENFVYQPYKEDNYSIDLQDNEMVSLPNGIKDELQIDKEGNVSLIKRVGKILLNSVERWNLIGDTDSYWEYANYSLSDSAKYSTCLSNYFSSEDDNRLIYTLTQIYCRFPKSLGIDVSDTDKFKQWLSSNDVYGYYQKETPQTISLGKLEDLISTDEGANTFAINGNIDTNISTTYALDLKKYIDNKIATVSSVFIEQE